MKVLAPNRVFCLRGNHETRDLQKGENGGTFCKELQIRFDTKGAEMAFKMFNAVFDSMPLAAVIDEQIFCCHAGIPSTSNPLQAIANIPPVLKDPEKLAIANEILWNDPITDREYHELKTQKPELAKVNGVSLPDGFLFNVKRNSGCLFSETAISRFLSANGFSHIIRAHESSPSKCTALLI